MIETLKKFFREDTSEIIGAYFDGEKIFIARLTDKFETTGIDALDATIEELAEKISLVCKQKGWKASAVGRQYSRERTSRNGQELGNSSSGRGRGVFVR